MKKVMVILFVGSLLAGCMSANYVYDGSQPRSTVANGDGSTTFEFLYPESDFNGNKASQRIDEYCVRYRNENGLTGYEVLGMSYSNHRDLTKPGAMNTHVLVQVRFWI
jgi:hypothetical protein